MYENHQYFKRAKQCPSFVRIFTNMPLPGLKLPLTQGYRLVIYCMCKLYGLTNLVFIIVCVEYVIDTSVRIVLTVTSVVFAHQK